MEHVKFDSTVEEMDLIYQINERAAQELGVEDAMSLAMDLDATNSNGTPLDFEKLLGFDKFSFAHDINGIMGHLDRTDGVLKGGFLPRCSKKK